MPKYCPRFNLFLPNMCLLALLNNNYSDCGPCIYLRDARTIQTLFHVCDKIVWIVILLQKVHPFIPYFSLQSWLWLFWLLHPKDQNIGRLGMWVNVSVGIRL